MEAGMKVKTIFVAALLLVATSLTAFGGVKFVKTWKNPDAQPGNWQGKKVAAFALTFQKSNREAAEKALVRELNQRGAQAVPGHTLVPPAVEKDRDAVKRILVDAGISGAVIMNVIGLQDDLVITADQTIYLGPNYATFWGYWSYGATIGYIPGNVGTKMTLVVESLVYSLDQDKLLWAGTSKVVNPKDIDEAVKDMAKAVGSQVKKAGLFKSSTQ
jgi:hypothetical protein